MNVLITGANRGIGLSLAKKLSQNENLTCLQRSTSNELKEVNANIIEGFDFSNSDFLSKLDLLPKDLDLAIFNAGIFNHTEEEINIEKVMQEFMVNSVSQVALAQKMKGHFSKGAKVVFISSVLGSVAENVEGSMGGYKASKTALNSLAITLSHQFKRDGISVYLLHPGYVQTEMTGNNGNITADQAATNILNTVAELTPEKTGLYWHTEESREIPW